MVTGGEPLTFNLDHLCAELRKNNIAIFLETSGSQNFSGEWDWICLSPKIQTPPFDIFYTKADELKVIIQDESDFIWAEKNADLISKEAFLLLQPEWSKRKEMIPVIVDYILRNPKWQISLQTHKYLNIP